MNRRPAAGVALVLAAAALWGTTGTAQTFVSGSVAGPWFGALRLLVASLFFAACAAWLRRQAPALVTNRRLPLAALAGAGLCMAVYNLAFFAGIRSTGVAIGTAVALGSGPVWAGILQSLLVRRAPPAAWWWGTAVAVAGGALMSLGAGTGASRDGGLALAGLGGCLLAGLAYAVYTLLGQRMVGSAAPTTITLCAFTTAAALALPAAWLDSGPPRLTIGDAAPVLYVGVVTAGVGYLLFAHALRHIGAATAVTLALAEPATAYALAVVVVGERPGWASLAGLLLVLAGVLAVVRTKLAAGPRAVPASAAAAPRPAR